MGMSTSPMPMTPRPSWRYSYDQGYTWHAFSGREEDLIEKAYSASKLTDDVDEKVHVITVNVGNGPFPRKFDFGQNGHEFGYCGEVNPTCSTPVIRLKRVCEPPITVK